MSQLQSGDLFVGKLVRLSAPRLEDKDALAMWSNDAEFQRLLDDDPSRPRSAEYYADNDKDREKQREREHREFEFRIRTIAEDRLIGFTALWVNWKNQVAWLGMGIGDAEYRDKGYGTDALRLTVNYGFRELNLYKVTLSVFSYNPRARHIYEKAGFVLEGTQRAALYRDGERHDMHIMGILRPEWEVLRARQEALAAPNHH